MKRLLWGLPLALLLGCPLYDDCSSGRDCAEGFQCDGYRQQCVPVPAPVPSCSRPEHCAAGETCTPDGICKPGSCDYHGCVAGFACSIVEGVHACVATGSTPGLDAGPDRGDAAVASDASAGGDAAATPTTSTPSTTPDSGTPDASPDAG